MKVRALRHIASPHGTALAGEVMDVTPEVGSDWIERGLVERAEREIETAVRPVPAGAVVRKGKR